MTIVIVLMVWHAFLRSVKISAYEEEPAIRILTALNL